MNTGHSNATTATTSTQKKKKPRRRRQIALWRFLATSPSIGGICAPDFDGAHPQGVQWDSLNSFKLPGEAQVGHTPALRAFLCAQRWHLYYMYPSTFIYIIYSLSIILCEHAKRQQVAVRWFHLLRHQDQVGTSKFGDGKQYPTKNPRDFT
jgi:hypothetical protein